MKHIVITGGTRGIGYGLVREFLNRNFNVTFCGSSDNTVINAMSGLEEEWPAKRFRGVVCDVSKSDDLENMWAFSSKIFGKPDIWINNAGISNPAEKFNDLDFDLSAKIIDVNLKGAMYATKMAFLKMKDSGGGHIYNMGGLGSDGRMVKGLTPYGTSKRALQYFTKAFSKEISSNDSVRVGLLIPGMVLTDMLLDPVRNGTGDKRKLKRLYNMLADEVEPVCSVLAEKIVNNSKNGAVLSYTGSLKMFLRIPGRLLSRRDIVSGKL